MSNQLAFLPQSPASASIQFDSRQRLLSMGASSLTTQELLSVLSGKPEVAEWLWLLLNEHDRPFHVLRDITLEQLQSVSGIGPYKAATILAAVELGRRSFNPVDNQLVVLDDPAIAASVLSADLMWQSVEKFAVLFLDVKHRLIGKKVTAVGTATEVLAHPRDIFKAAIDARATRIIVAHNHPSNGLNPSHQDIELTRQILAGADVLGIPVLDHLILGNGNHLSIRQHDPSLWATSEV
ncbi:MAG: DNA repair protein RadC [Cyanobacteria bacterium P01_F01_bin.150]